MIYSFLPTDLSRRCPDIEGAFMSEPHVFPPVPDPQPRPASPPPVAPPAVGRQAPPPPAAARGRSFLGIALTFSVLFNCLAVVVLCVVCLGVVALRSPFDADALANTPLNETFLSGNTNAKDKIAVIHMDGIIMEGAMQYPHKQIEQAVEDDHVKAVVLRINSPGGSITASDELHRRIVNLQEGTTPGKSSTKKPVVVSMGSLAASGGYYIAAPAHTIVAERTTLTGSIGVYAAFPNIAGLAKEYKFGMVTIKQGKIKDSGSPFKEMSDEERRVWQDMVDHAYLQFLDVVTEGRGDRLKVKPLEEFDVQPAKGQKKLAHPPAGEPYKRYLADGGIFTADKAVELGLVDQIGYLDTAITVAKKAANLDEYKAVQYEKPKTLAEILLGAKAKPPTTGLLDPGTVKNGFVPRLWYLMPGSEAAGILAGMEASPE
jgi:protease-4